MSVDFASLFFFLNLFSRDVGKLGKLSEVERDYMDGEAIGQAAGGLQSIRAKLAQSTEGR